MGPVGPTVPVEAIVIAEPAGVIVTLAPASSVRAPERLFSVATWVGTT